MNQEVSQAQAKPIHHEGGADRDGNEEDPRTRTEMLTRKEIRGSPSLKMYY
jgi:hypothetical protein